MASVVSLLSSRYQPVTGAPPKNPNNRTCLPFDLPVGGGRGGKTMRLGCERGSPNETHNDFPGASRPDRVCRGYPRDAPLQNRGDQSVAHPTAVLTRGDCRCGGLGGQEGFDEHTVARGAGPGVSVLIQEWGRF